MRPLHLKLLAAVLLAVCALLVMRKPASHDFPASYVPTESRNEMPRAAGQARNSASAASSLEGEPLPPDNEEGARFPNITGIRPTAGISDISSSPPSSSRESATDAAKRGVQLADDVRLPAAIMAQGVPDATTHNMTSPAAAANREIVNSFYRELLATADNTPATADPATGGEQTAVVPPGAGVDNARRHADELYRAMFGDAAFNQQGISSAIEVRLPVDSGHP